MFACASAINSSVSSFQDLKSVCHHGLVKRHAWYAHSQGMHRFGCFRESRPTNDIRLYELYCAIHSFNACRLLSELIWLRIKFLNSPVQVLQIWCLQAVVIPCFSETMATLLRSGGMNIADATFHLWIKELHTPRCLQAVSILCFSEAMAKLLLSDAGLLDGVAFHRWTKEFHTPRCPQEVVIQFFWEVMAKLWLVEAEMASLWPRQVMAWGSAAFHHWLKDFYIPRCLQGWITRYFSEVMGKLLLAGRPQRMGDARYRLWIKEFHTPRCLQVVTIQYFSEVMAPLWPAEVMTRGNATFHYWMKGFFIPRCLQAVSILCFSEVMAKL